MVARVAGLIVVSSLLGLTIASCAGGGSVAGAGDAAAGPAADSSSPNDGGSSPIDGGAGSGVSISGKDGPPLREGYLVHTAAGAPRILFFSAPGAYAACEQEDHVLPNEDEVLIVFSSPAVPGSYAVTNGTAGAGLHVAVIVESLGDRCATDPAQRQVVATSGTVVIEGFGAGGGIRGSIDASDGARLHLQGQFDVQACDAVDYSGMNAPPDAGALSCAP